MLLTGLLLLLDDVCCGRGLLLLGRGDRSDGLEHGQARLLVGRPLEGDGVGQRLEETRREKPWMEGKKRRREERDDNEKTL